MFDLAHDFEELPILWAGDADGARSIFGAIDGTATITAEADGESWTVDEIRLSGWGRASRRAPSQRTTTVLPTDHPMWVVIVAALRAFEGERIEVELADMGLLSSGRFAGGRYIA